MTKLLPRKQLEKYFSCRREDGINTFCVVITGDEIPHWMTLFIAHHKNAGDALIFPEISKSIKQQGILIDKLFNNPSNEIKFVVTRSPWIVTEFERLAVFTVRDSKVEIPEFETFGASANKINFKIFKHCNTCGLRAERIMKAIGKRVKLIKDPDKLDRIIDEEINNRLGESVEKTLLLHTIFSRIDELKGVKDEEATA